MNYLNKTTLYDALQEVGGEGINEIHLIYGLDASKATVNVNRSSTSAPK